MSGSAASLPSPGWVDVAPLLEAATLEMRSGQLIHDDAFSLFNSMSAIQIMDPKMDVGMAPPPGEPQVKSARALIGEGRAPLDPSDADLVYLFDALLACEATWHTGQAMATTVYTCLYMHDRERLEMAPSPVLRAYVEAVRTSVATVRFVVQEANIYEEEDFILATSGFDVGFAAIGDPNRPDTALAGLRAAEAWLLQRGGEGEAGDEDAASSALLTRVRFRIALHTAMVHLFQPPNSEDAEAARACLDQAAACLADMRGSLERLPLPKRGVDVGNGAGKCSNDGVGSSGGQPSPPKPSESEAIGGGELDWDPSGLGFDRKVNLTKLGPSPPRVVKLHSRAAAVDAFIELVTHLRSVADVAALHERGDGALHEVLAMLSATSEQNPGIVSRSFFTCALFRAGLLGKHIGDAVLRSAWMSGTTPPPVVDMEAGADQELEELDDLGGTGDAGGGGAAVGGGVPVLSGRGVTGGDDHGARALRDFLAESARPTELLVRAYLANRSRLRRKLRRLLPEWIGMQERGKIVDGTGFTIQHLGEYGESNLAASEVLARTPWAGCAFGSWSTSMLVRIQLSHLTLGFSLELYLPHELCMVYWYMEYLKQNLIDVLRVAEMSLSQEAAAAKSFATAPGNRKEGGASKKGGKKGGKGGKKGGGGRDGGGARGKSSSYEGDDGASLVRVKMESYVLELQKTMCKGLVRLLAGLNAAHRLKRPLNNIPGSTEEEQNFWQRFGVFHICQEPQAMSYPDFASYTRLDGVTAERLFASAAECFAQVRAQVKQLMSLPAGILTPVQAADLSGIDKVAAANAMATKLVEMPGVTVDFDYKHHPVFATLVVRREKT